MDTPKLKQREKILYGFCVIAFIIIVILIALLVTYNVNIGNDNETFSDELNTQPMVFTKNLQSVPGGCEPYKGCYYPMTNPVDLQTGKRFKAEHENDIWCEKSWRDCNAYQTCENGKCIPK